MNVDIVNLFDHVWSRFVQRMEGLTDDEWKWQPLIEPKVSLEWRLKHIGDMLGEQRNADWLGRQRMYSPIVQNEDARSAVDALARTSEAYKWWRDILLATPSSELADSIGTAAGNFGDATKYSFIFHVADELIHHTAEVALLRDFYENHA